MSSTSRQAYTMVDQQQQQVHSEEENQCMYAVMNDVPLSANNDMQQEQQIVYCNPPRSYQQINNPQQYVYQQQIPNNQNFNQYEVTSVPIPYQHQHHFHPTSINMPPMLAHQTVMHSNTNKEQAMQPAYYPFAYTTAPPPTTISRPAVSSTPISVTAKRGGIDTSGTSESNAQQRPTYPQAYQFFNSNNTPNKRLRGANQYFNEGLYHHSFAKNQPVQSHEKVIRTDDATDLQENQQQPSVAACRFATPRFPFSLFSVIFSQDVKEKTVVDDLIKHAKDNYTFELKTVAYRRGHSKNNECRILIFVENTESFAFLYEQNNWPATLAEYQFIIRSPSIPPHLALVLPHVSLQTDWDEFVQELKETHPGIANIIRLNNRAQQPVRVVKLELRLMKLRDEILEAGEISIMHMKLKVVDYMVQANVLICSNCYGISHFRKNCPQKEESTCKTCGDKCPDLKGHQCSGVLKCIHCGGQHYSNDTKCKVVKDYRAVLTRNLLRRTPAANMEVATARPFQTNTWQYSSIGSHLPYSTVAQRAPSNSNDVIIKKLDSVLVKVKGKTTDLDH